MGAIKLEQIIALLVFGAVMFGFWAIKDMISVPEQERKGQLPLLFRIFSPGIFFFGEQMGRFLENSMPESSTAIKDEIRRAALPFEVRDVYGAIAFFTLLGALVGVLTAQALPPSKPALKFFIVIVFIIVGLIYPRMYIKSVGEKRMDAILHSLPFAIDLLTSSMSAGLDFGAAVRYLVTTGDKDDVLKREFNIFLADVELGKTRTEALFDMQERIGVTEFTRFVSAISYGMDSGSSIIDIMRIQAEEMRRVKYARAEQQAAKAPIKMIIPMALFVFPSMFIMIFVPIFIRIKDSGVTSLFGK